MWLEREREIPIIVSIDNGNLSERIGGKVTKHFSVIRVYTSHGETTQNIIPLTQFSGSGVGIHISQTFKTIHTNFGIRAFE